MSREKQLLKNTIIVAIGKICTQFVSFILLPLYTAILSAEEYGTVDLLNTYISLLIPVIFLQIDQAIFRFLLDVRENKEEQEKLISTTIITVLGQAILYLIVYAIIGRFINNQYKYFLATNVVAAMLSNVLLQIARGVGDNTTYSFGSVVSGVTTVILNVLFIVVFKWGAYGMLSATFIANIVCALVVFIRKKLYKFVSTKKYSKDDIKKLWKYSLPLVPNQLSWWIITVSDRSIVTWILGAAANGIYSASTKFSSICISLFNIFSMTWSESASMYINSKDSSEYFSNIINSSIKLFAAVCLEIIAVLPFLFRFIITGEEYASAYYQIPILMVATIFNIVMALLGSIYVALKKSNEIAKTSVYSAIINILVNVVLIKFIGLYAASISTLVSYVVLSVYRYLDVQKYVKIKLDNSVMLVLVDLFILVCITYYYNNVFINVLMLILISVYSIFANKEMIQSLIKTVSNKLNVLTK